MPSENLKEVTEAELKAHAVAPRVTPEMIESQIDLVAYTDVHDLVAHAAYKVVDNKGEQSSLPDDAPLEDAMRVFTLCVIILKNGFIVTGNSAPASPKNFNPQIGQKLAYQNAFNQLWPLFGFALKQMLHAETEGA